MEKQFATYEIALGLKELGFDEEVIAAFNTEDKVLSVFAFSVPNKGIFEQGFEKGWCIKAPLWQQAIDWFRIKHNIEIHPKKVYLLPVCEENIKWIARIDVQESLGSAYADTQYQTYNTYEEARYAGILKAIELCQEK